MPRYANRDIVAAVKNSEAVTVIDPKPDKPSAISLCEMEELQRYYDNRTDESKGLCVRCRNEFPTAEMSVADRQIYDHIVDYYVCRDCEDELGG